MKTFFLIASMAIAALATTVPSPLGVEVVRDASGGISTVREVRRSLAERQGACTNCVHVGDKCTIGEGNCYASESALCTDCGSAGSICVDQNGGTCSAP